ncbi:protein-tyrosine phosphatase [Paraburkholderia piptadeniae]|uniref:protein-tyrosine-phosphatase n=2 Tax=Paraburkholderia piptadeniae TaxID=1701573 RepID=A0A1N7SKR8_9BURK|nr:protein-tyrosine phosphatase [Paraburkholderia piptadeniae]
MVCVGNICRSPMAEYILRQELKDIRVLSAGLDALVGHPADESAIRVAAEFGLDISSHHAQQINGALVSGADLILAMEGSHKHEIIRRHPFASGKVFRLGEHEDFDVPDPYRKSLDHFVDSFQLIRRGVKLWTPRIRALARF